MSNKPNVIAFHIYTDGMAKHTYKGIDIDYEVITLYPKELHKHVVKIADEYRIKCSNNFHCPMSVNIYDTLSIRESSLAAEYGVLDVKQ